MNKMITKIQNWGNSQAVRLPKSILKKVGWDNGECVELSVENDSIVIKKKVQYPTLEEMFANYEGGTGEAYDWGNPVGKEI